MASGGIGSCAVGIDWQQRSGPRPGPGLPGLHRDDPFLGRRGHPTCQRPRGPRQDRPTGIGTSIFAVRNVRRAAAWSDPDGTGDSHSVRKNPLVRALRLGRRDPCLPATTAQDRFIAAFPLVPILADIYSPRCAREDGRAGITAFEACDRTYSQVRDMIRARQRHGRRCAAAYKEIMNKVVFAGPDTCRYPLAGARRERAGRERGVQRSRPRQDSSGQGRNRDRQSGSERGRGGAEVDHAPGCFSWSRRLSRVYRGDPGAWRGDSGAVAVRLARQEWPGQSRMARREQVLSSVETSPRGGLAGWCFRWSGAL